MRSVHHDRGCGANFSVPAYATRKGRAPAEQPQIENPACPSKKLFQKSGAVTQPNARPLFNAAEEKRSMSQFSSI